MADAIHTYRIPEAKVKPLAQAILASNPGEQDDEGNPIPETDAAVIDRFVIDMLQAVEQRYRRRQLSAGVDETLVVKEP